MNEQFFLLVLWTKCEIQTNYFLFDGIYVGMVCIVSKGVHLGWVLRSRFCNFQYVDES